MSDDNNKDNGAKTILLPPLNEDDIARKSITLLDLWMIKDTQDKIYGPYSTYQLREYSQSHLDTFEKCLAFNLAKEEWGNFFSIPHFQRRLPQLVNGMSLEIAGDFYILKNGQKHGPYTLEQLHIMHSTSELQLNDLISTDNGVHWIKLFEHHAFDRRSRNVMNNKLPKVPNNHLFNEMEKIVPGLIKSKRKIKDEEDALVGLAFIGHGHDKGQTMGQEQTSPRLMPMPGPQNENKPIKWGHFAINFSSLMDMSKTKKQITLSLFAIMAFSIFFNTFQSNHSKIDDSVANYKPVSNSKKIVNDERRPEKKVDSNLNARPLAERLPASLPKTNSNTARKKTRVIKKSVKSRNMPTKKMNFHHIDINDPEIRREISNELDQESNLDNNDGSYADEENNAATSEESALINEEQEAMENEDAYMQDQSENIENDPSAQYPE